MTILLLIIWNLNSLVVAGNFPSEQEDWKLAKEKNGISIYVSKPSRGTLKPYRGEMVVNATIDKITSILTDHKNFTSWIYKCIESQLLETSTNGDTYLYYVTKAPWPIRNRDSVTRMRIVNLSHGSLRVDLEDVPGRLEHKKNMVRIPFMKGYWQLDSLSDGRTAVTHFVHAHPGGAIPSWLANLSVTEAPFHTMTKLRELAEK